MNPERLIATLLQSKASDEEILAVIPLLAKSVGVKLEPAVSAALFTRLAELIGASPTDKDEVLQQKLQAYYKAHPPSVALQQALKGFLEEQSGVKRKDGFEAVSAGARLTSQQVLSPSLRPDFPSNDKKERK